MKPVPVLFVEDDPDLQFTVMEALRAEPPPGYEVIPARSARAALALLASTRPSLIIMDLTLPDMDPLEFRASMRALPGVARVPLIVASGRPDADQWARDLGAVTVLNKPFNLESLSITVAAVMEAVASAPASEGSPQAP